MRRSSIRDVGLMFDEEFNKNMKIANFLVKKLEAQKDAERAKYWLMRVGNIKSSNLEVKRNRNTFLTYLIKVLGDGVLPGCADGRSDTVCDPDNALRVLHGTELSDTSSESSDDEPPPKKVLQFQSNWSKDRRTYVAVKPLPGRGALVFMAVSKRPGLENWDLPPLMKSHLMR